MNTVEQWSAEACGVELNPPPQDSVMIISWVYWRLNGDGYTYPWTLDDARCREIVREHFKIDTTWTTNNDWYCFVELDKDNYLVEERGKTIEEAEKACIEAIHQAAGEQE